MTRPPSPDVLPDALGLLCVLVLIVISQIAAYAMQP